MGHAVAEAAIGAGLHIVPFGLTGPGLGGQVVNLNNVQVHLHDVSEKETVMDKVLNQYPNVIIVDYTLPAAVNGKHRTSWCYQVKHPTELFFHLFFVLVGRGLPRWSLDIGNFI